MDSGSSWQEGAKHARFSLQVDMQCRCMGCVGKVEKAMAAVGSFTGVETAVGDVNAGVVAVAGKVDPAELCQWLKRKTRKDVKIVCPHPPKMILVLGGSSRIENTTPSAPPLPQHFSSALAPSGVQSGHEDLHLIEEKIRDLERARDALKVRSLKNELTAAKSELKQSREVISNSKKALLDSALSQLDAFKKLESLTQATM
uniref:HMA domain-containing protein n=1 Tax=Aegilops tauschii subsp. strangulata TaxID=200361 RepID=A0A453LJG1_AEGTS